MSTLTNNAPSWLFSFVDLAFLMLIAVTQIGSDERARAVELGEIAVPRLDAGVTNPLAGDAPDRWQLRVHPPLADREPYELFRSDREPAERLEIGELKRRLTALRRSEVEQPLLAPHADSRSQDMLDAVGLLESLWAQGRLATVVPEYAAR